MRSFTSGAGPVVAIVVLLLASLTLMSDATQGSARFGELYSILLVVNALGLLILAGLIGWNLYRLLGQVHRRQPGARLTVRMVAMFVVLAVTPVLVVYYFSVQFLHRGIDSWFDVRIERALDDALELSRTALGVRMRELHKQMELLVGELAPLADDHIAGELENARRLSGASEITVFDHDGRIIAFSNIDPTDIVPDRPTETVLLQLRQTGSYIGLDPIGHAGLHVRVLLNVPEELPTREPRVLQALVPISERMSGLADTVQDAYAKYRELAYLRKPLKVSFMLTLSLVMLLGLFTAVWAAFLSARRMVAPLRDVAHGTRAVAAGDYETQLPPASRDEVGFLVESFNEMTRRLAEARDQTRRSQQRVEEQRAYLEAVLGRLSTGVITLDNEAAVHTCNDAAVHILEVDLLAHAGTPLERLADRHEHLRPLVEAVSRQLASFGESGTARDWRVQVALAHAGSHKVLTVSGTALPEVGGPSAGHVIVFDDITALIQAQRDAAWSEVARRLAHEIKNPLTPIRLSAERLRHKYLARMQPDEGEALDRLTRTIVHQVEAMKDMVDEFSDYARNPAIHPMPLDVNQLIADVVELYRSGEGAVRVDTVLDPRLPDCEVDAASLRQVLHNLLKNALEADDGADRAPIRVTTSRPPGDDGRVVEITVRDHGPGIPDRMADRLFEPYVTGKPKGTGLGLAIVKKIVEEHGGTVRAESPPDGGAAIVVRLPTRAAGDAGARREPQREAV